VDEIRPLPWDTQFFEMPIGRLDLTTGVEVERILKLLHMSPYRVVVIHIENPSDNDLRLMSHVAVLVDLKLVYVKQPLTQISDNCLSVVNYKGPVTYDIIELAYASGVYSRFKQDPGFEPYFKQLYRLWIEKSIAGELADAVFVYFIDSKPAGLITVKKAEQEAVIGLLSVDEKHRRIGIASKLINRVEHWCTEEQYNRVMVATQSANIPACRFYEKQAYACEKRFGIYHFWKD